MPACSTTTPFLGTWTTGCVSRSLMSYEIPVKHIIVNQVYPEIPDCDFCRSRRAFQVRHLGEIRDLYREEFDVIEMPLFETEIRKYDQLRKMGRVIVEGEKP